MILRVALGTPRDPGHGRGADHVQRGPYRRTQESVRDMHRRNVTTVRARFSHW